MRALLVVVVVDDDDDALARARQRWSRSRCGAWLSCFNEEVDKNGVKVCSGTVRVTCYVLVYLWVKKDKNTTQSNRLARVRLPTDAPPSTLLVDSLCNPI